MTKLNKITSVLLSAIMVIGIFSVIPFAASATEKTKDWEYTISNGEVTVTKYIGTATDVVIPETIEGKPVTEVSEFCFVEDLKWDYSNYTITSLYIPKDVRKITPIWSEDGLGLCFIRNLKAIRVDESNPYYISIDGVLFIRDKTKILCYPREKTDTNYTVPGEVKFISTRAFANQEFLKVLKFVSDCESIGSAAFVGMKKLEEADYPVYLTPNDTIFDLCQNLKKVYCSKDVALMDEYDFSNCPNVTLYVYNDSYALAWAKEHNKPYVIIEEEPTVPTEPTEPTVPTAPTEPTAPTPGPTVPTPTPTNSTNPTPSDNSNNGSNNTNGGAGNTSVAKTAGKVATGDSASVAAMVFALILSAGTSFVLLRKIN